MSKTFYLVNRERCEKILVIDHSALLNIPNQPNEANYLQIWRILGLDVHQFRWNL